MQNKSQTINGNGLKTKATRTQELSRYIGVLIVVLLVAGYGLVRVLSPQNNAAQVRFVETSPDENQDLLEPPSTYTKWPLAGSEYEEAVRLRQTAALGMAISLTVLSSKTETGNLPRTAGDISRIIANSRLWPPGVQIVDGVISSDESLFQIAYSNEPFSFSVLGVPRSDSGSQVLFKFPIPASEPNSVLYFEAVRDKPTPLLLETSEQLAARGWKIRHWRGDSLPLTAATVEALREQSTSLRSL